MGRWLRALALSCHPVPALAVTAISAGLAILAAVQSARAVLLVVAVFAGQLSIGWSNDAIDAVRDRASGRADKPVARGELSVGAVRWASAGALAIAIALSLGLGWAPGLAALTVVACGWLYNLGLKATVLSFIPYAVAFGMLPAVATLALPTPTWPARWAMIAGALFGVAAHLANVLPDIDQDVRTGVRGLPQRLGPRGTAVACPVLLGLACMVIVFGPAGWSELARWKWVAVAVLVVLTAVGVVVGLRRPQSKALFLVVILAAAGAVALFAASGQSLT